MTPPIRTCLGCRGRGAKAGLVRLVRDSATGAVAVDTRQVMPGRGCYVHPGCAEQVSRRKLLGRALRATVDGEQSAAVLGALAASATQGPA